MLVPCNLDIFRDVLLLCHDVSGDFMKVTVTTYWQQQELPRHRALSEGLRRVRR